MAYQNIDGVRVWGNPDNGALAQAKTFAETEASRSTTS